MSSIIKVVFLLSANFWLTGCILVPVPTSQNKVLAGQPVQEEQLAFIIQDVTTKEEIIEKLGSPEVIWEDKRVFVYPWEMRQGILFWAFGGPGSAAGGAYEIPKYHMLLIQFDEWDKVQRFERTVRPSTQSEADFLTNWYSHPEANSPPEPRGTRVGTK